MLLAWLGDSPRGEAAAIVGSLKAVWCTSKVWARRKRAPPSLHSNCKFVIYLFDVLEEGRSVSIDETLLRRDCQDRLALALHKRAAYWKQRGKHHAIREGYVNMRFFLAQATQRLHRNNIRALEMDGIVVSSHHDKTAALRSHLQSLLGANTVAPGSIDVAALYAVSTKVDTAPLIAPFTEPEACVAVRSMNL